MFDLRRKIFEFKYIVERWRQNQNSSSHNYFILGRKIAKLAIGPLRSVILKVGRGCVEIYFPVSFFLRTISEIDFHADFLKTLIYH